MSTEHKLAKLADVPDGGMLNVEVDDHNILLIRSGDEIRAFIGTCPHQGATLADGLCRDGRVRCPWHHAVFDADSGEVLQPPSLDSLPKLDARVDGEDVVVKAPDEMPAARVPEMAGLDTEADGRTFVIVGAGAAGSQAAETLRREGYQGRIVLITREDHRPYDRTELSKYYLGSADAKTPYLRPDSFYDAHGIELWTGCEVTSVDVEAKTVSFADRDPLSYDKCLVATGGVPRTLGAPGADLDGVATLRSLDDCERLRERARKGRRAVVVGASFIAMEVAASLNKRGMHVTIVAPESMPFDWTLGEQIGRKYRDVHERKGNEFRLERKVERFEGDGKLEAVVLDDSERIEAELAVVGVGVRPATGLLKGVELNRDGSANVDAHMRLAEDTYAAGDIVCFPDPRTARPTRIEHWRVAQQQGQVAGRCMAGADAVYNQTPFFWTEQFMVIVDHAGRAQSWDDIFFDGDPGGKAFLAYYVRDGRVLAASGSMVDRKLALVAELIRAVESPTVESVREAIEQVE